MLFCVSDDTYGSKSHPFPLHPSRRVPVAVRMHIRLASAADLATLQERLNVAVAETLKVRESLLNGRLLPAR